MDDQPGLNEPSDEPENENRGFVPEVMAGAGSPTPVPALDENAMIEDSVRFINRTVAQMVFGASVIIGEHLLTRYFGGDIELAMSKAHNKPVSFNRLCRRPDISLTSRMLGGMVRVAAQDRYFQGIGLDVSKLHYTHKLLLTRLPNDGAKAELDQLERETQERLRLQAVEWLEKMEARRAACADLIIRLEDVMAHPNY